MIDNNFYNISYYDIKTAEVLRREQVSFNSLAVACTQAMEKMAKSVLEDFCFDVPKEDNVYRTHKLANIGRAINHAGIGLTMDLNDLRKVSDYYFDARYPGVNFIVVTKEEAEEAYDIMMRFKEQVDNFYRLKGICPFCKGKLSEESCTNIECEWK